MLDIFIEQTCKARSFGISNIMTNGVGINIGPVKQSRVIKNMSPTLSSTSQREGDA